MTIDVVYLAYFNEDKGYDIGIVKNFLDSYNKHSAGIGHSLTIIVKNCSNKILYKEISALAQNNNARVIELPNDGLDFGAYFRVAKLLNNEYIFFCGGKLKVSCDNWLSKFYNAFKNDNLVQLAGSMGSWADSKFEKFPNYHIRTTTFMLKRELFLEYASTVKFPATKEDTYEIEHGENSLTNFVLKKGYKAVVVNSDGKVFTPENWDVSQTFRYPGKLKSIFEDRHTKIYDEADSNEKQDLERYAWGRSLKETKVKIFVIYHRDEPFFASEVFQPIYTGAYNFNSGAYMLRDNLDDNISKKNSHYRELTGHYWIWKNLLPKLDVEYVGFSHYCRFLDFNLLNTDNNLFCPILANDFQKIFLEYTEENILNCIKDYDVAVPQKFISPKNIHDLFLDFSTEKEIDAMMNVISEIHPEYSDAAKKVMDGNELYACLIFIMKKNLVVKYMEWVFSILSILEKRIDLSKYDGNSDNHILVNMAEVLFNIWLQKHSKEIKIVETTSLYVDTSIDEVDTAVI